MVDEAPMESDEHGRYAAGDGWYTLHVAEARWITSDRFGSRCRLEGEKPFPDMGVHLYVLEPGKPACLYHRESAQEDFFVISGRCTLLVEGQERPLRAGHFIHCPPDTHHVFVGAGEEPCVMLMMGHRPAKKEIFYPVDPTARKHGASAVEATDDPRKAYEGLSRRPSAPMWPLYGVD